MSLDSVIKVRCKSFVKVVPVETLYGVDCKQLKIVIALKNKKPLISEKLLCQERACLPRSRLACPAGLEPVLQKQVGHVKKQAGLHELMFKRF